MVVSGIVFLAGARAAVLRLCPGAPRLATVLLAVFGAAAVGKEITPDLLMAGLFAPAVARVLAGGTHAGRGGALATGALFGAAFLAKAVALPASLLVLAAAGILRLLLGQARRAILQDAASAALGLLLVAGPWIAVLTVQAGRPTLGTTARVNHALVGPTDVDRFHPTFRTLHVPGPGRLSTWEAPDALPYREWSPLASSQHLAHFASSLRANARTILRQLGDFDLLGLGVVAAVLGFAAHLPWRSGMARARWRWSLLGVLLPSALYLPFLSSCTRYYTATYPFLLVAAIGVTRSLLGPAAGAGARLLLTAVVGVAFLGVSAPSLGRSLARPRGNPELADARAWQAALAGSGLTGPVASIDPNGHTAFYTAHLGSQPFLGNVLELRALPELAAVGARVVFVKAGTAAAASLAGASEYERLPAPPGSSGRSEVWVRRP
jgi:hypothetical protein